MFSFFKIFILSIISINSLVATFPIRFGQYHIQGRRPTMEDVSLVEIPLYKNQQNTALFAIFDGHGGSSVAEYVGENFVEQLIKSEGNAANRLRNSVKSIDKNLKDLKKANFCGTCAIIAVVEDDKLTIANLGDSRAVLCRAGNAIPLSQDHTPESQVPNIKKLGGFVCNGRLNGNLGVARAIGDHSSEFIGISHEPDIHEIEIQSDDEFLILMCDGIYDKVSENEVEFELIPPHKAVEIVRESLIENSNDPERAEMAARKLVATAYQNGSIDNLSVIVILLNQE